MEIFYPKQPRNYAKIIVIAVVLAALGLCGLFVNGLNREAISTSIIIYKKEVLKDKRNKLTEQIQELDERLGISTGETLK